MGPTPVYGARAEKPLQNADFAMKQTNICRLSGDIIMLDRAWSLPRLHPLMASADRQTASPCQNYGSATTDNALKNSYMHNLEQWPLEVRGAMLSRPLFQAKNLRNVAVMTRPLGGIVGRKLSTSGHCWDVPRSHDCSDLRASSCSSQNTPTFHTHFSFLLNAHSSIGKT